MFPIEPGESRAAYDTCRFSAASTVEGRDAMKLKYQDHQSKKNLALHIIFLSYKAMKEKFRNVQILINFIA